MKTYSVAVVTPEKAVFEGEASFVLLRSTEGDLGILKGHTPLVTELVAWPLEVRTEQGPRRYAVSGGFLDVRPERVTILARTAETPEEIDRPRAERALERAKKRLEDDKKADVDRSRAKEALQRAEARLKVQGSSER